MRLVAASCGLALLVAGAVTLASGFDAVGALLSQNSGHIFSQRDTLYVAVWVVFSASLCAAGVSLLYSAYRARRHNMVPGPTLYVAGASLMIIALFMVAAGVWLAALVAAAVAAALMVAEYSSEHV